LTPSLPSRPWRSDPASPKFLSGGKILTASEANEAEKSARFNSYIYLRMPISIKRCPVLILGKNGSATALILLFNANTSRVCGGFGALSNEE
jgi:hypothetical protein